MSTTTVDGVETMTAVVKVVMADEPAESLTDGPIPEQRFSLEEVARIAAKFQIAGPIRVADFPEKGNINQHTFLVHAGEGSDEREFLLQRINQKVFTRPKSVMAAMVASIEAQNAHLTANPLPGGEEWNTITLIPTHAGGHYVEGTDVYGENIWRMMVKIPNCRTYKSLSEIGDSAERLRVAEEAGRGLALYLRFTAGMDVSLIDNPLPGYRDTRLYYNQLLSVLQGNRTLAEVGDLLPTDETLRHSTQEHFLIHDSVWEDEYCRRMADPELQRFIALARENEDFALTLAHALSEGRISTVAIHGDTKLDNFLFCRRTDRVKAVVDLDTIMPQTWLADWGDMMRSLANVAGEKETDLTRVGVDMEIFRAVARGFLATARHAPEHEIALMVEAVQIIALELGIRFLADYLRGDSYFQLGPDDPRDLNKTRAMVQLTLFERLREQEADARQCIAELRDEFAS